MMRVNRVQAWGAVVTAALCGLGGCGQSKTDLGDGYRRWDWEISYPINNYNVALNIGAYVHFADRFGELPLDYYVLPENLEKARAQYGDEIVKYVTAESYTPNIPLAYWSFRLMMGLGFFFIRRIVAIEV